MAYFKYDPQKFTLTIRDIKDGNAYSHMDYERNSINIKVNDAHPTVYTVIDMIRLGEERGICGLKAKRIIFNNPATIVLWEDGTRTVVKCDKDDIYDPRTGVALCYMKKFLGNTSRELNKALRASGAYEQKKEE